MPPAETKYHQTQLYRYINCTDNIENNEVKKTMSNREKRERFTSLIISIIINKIVVCFKFNEDNDCRCK